MRILLGFGATIIFIIITCSANKFQLVRPYSHDDARMKNLLEVDSNILTLKKYNECFEKIDTLYIPNRNLCTKVNSEGIVVARTIIDRDGKLLEVQIIDTVHSYLDSLVINAIKLSTFRKSQDLTVNKYALILHFIFIYDHLLQDTLIYTKKFHHQTKKPKNDKLVIPYDKPPMPIGGFNIIQKYLKYPERARKLGITGRVLISGQVDKQGKFFNYRILEGPGCGTGEAAISAIKKCAWEPATNNGVPCTVWIAIPIDFKLR